VPDAAVFLDRDGVINVDHGYTHRVADLQFVPGSVAAMQRLQGAGWRLVVVTNQSGIARGLFTEDDYTRFTARLRSELQSAGVGLDAVLHCPHLPDATVAAYRQLCDCRKPAPGMLLRAARVTAWLAGRDYTTPEDVQAVFDVTIAHRLCYQPVYEMRRHEITGPLIAGILGKVAAP